MNLIRNYRNWRRYRDTVNRKMNTEIVIDIIVNSRSEVNINIALHDFSGIRSIDCDNRRF